MLTNLQQVDFCRAVYGAKWVYWYGTCGYKCTKSLYNSKRNQYPAHYTDARESGYMADIADGKMCADCVGLIKAFFWKGGDVNGENHYGANGCPDKSANGMFALCKETGDIAGIPEIPGLVVWKDGHIGVYVGDGYTIEMRGFAYDCVTRKVKEGPWTKWGRLPMLQYDDEPAPQEYELGERTLSKGCTGNDVKELQTDLLELGYSLPKYGADGDYGNETVKAVALFQTDHGLDATGVFDNASFKALTDALNGDTQPDDDDDTPDDGGAPAYVQIIEGDEDALRAIQQEYGGTLAAIDSVA